MRRSIALVCVLALAATVVSACGTAPASGPGASTPGEIVIGSTLCQTGIQAPLDRSALKGAQLAADMLNKQGGVLGKQVRIAAIDGKSDPVATAEAARQLIADGAVAIIAPSDYDFGGPASREAQLAGVVGISPGASSPLYGSATLGDKQFTLSMWNTTMGAAAAEYAYGKGLRTVYVITDDFLDYTRSLSRFFIIRFKQLGGTVLYEDTYTQGQGDAREQLARLRALKTKPDFVYVASYMPDLALIIRTLRENGMDMPVFGGDSYDNPALYEALGATYGNDIFFDTHGYLSEEASAKYPEFAAAYRAKFDEEPGDVWVLTGYDVVMVLAEAMTKAGSTDGAAVAKAMESTEWKLFTGDLKWSDAANGHQPDKAAVMVEVQDGKPSFIGWFRPEKTPAP